MKLNVRYANPTTSKKLVKIDHGDWIDLYSDETVEIKAGEYKMISLGVAIQLPEGYEANVVPRSSTFKTWGLLQTNSFGVIDESYCGNDDIWRFPAYATRDVTVNQGDKICQFRINKKMPTIEIVEVEQLEGKNRGGFGSTGKV
jgi:dUTP pyrophosphatase